MVNVLFYISACVAVVATILVIVQRNVVHALLYLIVSLLALAVIFYLLGAPFVAALEVVVYAGAIMVLFVFVVMMIGSGKAAPAPRAWIGPVALGIVLAAELAFVLAGFGTHPLGVPVGAAAVQPKQVGIALFGPYAVAAELASFLLLAGVVGAFHLGRRTSTPLGRGEGGEK